MTALPFILRRARRHWQILLALSLGVVLATALLASGPLLVDAVVEMGLTLTFRSADVTKGNLRLATDIEASAVTYQALDAEVNKIVVNRLGDVMAGTTRSIESDWWYPWLGGQLMTDQRVNFRCVEGIEEHVRFVAGAWPPDDSGDANVIPAVIGDGMARALALRVGDRLPLSRQLENAIPDLWMEIAGIVQSKNPQDRYWFGEYNPLVSRATRSGRPSTMHLCRTMSYFLPLYPLPLEKSCIFPGRYCYGMRPFLPRGSYHSLLRSTI